MAIAQGGPVLRTAPLLFKNLFENVFFVFPINLLLAGDVVWLNWNNSSTCFEEISFRSSKLQANNVAGGVKVLVVLSIKSISKSIII